MLLMYKHEKSIRFIGLMVLVVLLLTGCFSEPTKRAGAPDSLQVAPIQPRLAGYPEFSASDRARTAQAELPPLQPQYGQNPLYQGVKPVNALVMRDGAPGQRPLEDARLDPAGVMPVEQLIYGGPYAERDEEDRYQVLAGDRLRIQVSNFTEFSGIATVEPDGMMTIPGTKDLVKAKGLSMLDISRAVVAKIRPYLNSTPAVKVTVYQSMRGYYYIFGEVANQGRYAIGPKPIRVSEAVFRACSKRFLSSTNESREKAELREVDGSSREGFAKAEFANLESVNVVTPHRSHPDRRVYNIKQALFAGRTGDDPFLKPGQIVYVPPKASKQVTSTFWRVLEQIDISVGSH